MISSYQSQNIALMKSTIKPAENDDLEAFQAILQIDDFLGRYCVK